MGQSTGAFISCTHGTASGMSRQEQRWNQLRQWCCLTRRPLTQHANCYQDQHWAAEPANDLIVFATAGVKSSSARHFTGELALLKVCLFCFYSWVFSSLFRKFVSCLWGKKGQAARQGVAPGPLGNPPAARAAVKTKITLWESLTPSTLLGGG